MLYLQYMLHAPQAPWAAFNLDCHSGGQGSSGQWSFIGPPPLSWSLPGTLAPPPFQVFFLKAHLKGVPGATWLHLGSNLGQSWANLAFLQCPTGAKLRQVGSMLGPDGSKI